MAKYDDFGVTTQSDTVTCDGCGSEIKKGELFLGGIESCCGQCLRNICSNCIEKVHVDLLMLRSKLK